MRVAIIIATADRPASLGEALRSLSECELPAPDVHVVVADNGAKLGAEEPCGRVYSGLRVERIVLDRQCKSLALNAAVDRTDADLLLFTDDDVTVDVRWVAELERAARDWPGHVMFGGRVLPLWPVELPARLDGSAYLGPLYAYLDRGDVEGPAVGFRPFGPNMALRASVFERGFRFDERIGPGAAGGASMGEDTDVAQRLADQGQIPVYVPTSRVYHRVRPEQLSIGWQLGRGFRYGRAQAFHGSRPRGRTVSGLPRTLYREIVTSVVAAGWHGVLGRQRLFFDRLMAAAVALGRIAELRDR